MDYITGMKFTHNNYSMLRGNAVSKITFFVLASVLIFISGCLSVQEKSVIAPESGRSEINFNSDWKFIKDDPENAKEIDFDDSDWRSLNLPHDWAIEGPFDITRPPTTGKLPFEGVGWYRKHFNVDAERKDKRMFVRFDGAMSNSKVWINEHYLGRWPYGYNTFRFELTDYINFGGDNVIAVRLDNLPDSSRWYPGAGIYRNVRLETTENVHVAAWGNFVRCSDVSVSEKRATVKVTTEIENQLDSDVEAIVQQQIFSDSEDEKLCAAMSLDDVRIEQGSIRNTDFTFILSDVRLWDIDSPNLYTLRTTVKREGKTVDVYETKFGIRSVKFDPDEGFILNGRRVPLNGVCMHHDLGPLGTAVYKRAIERQLQMLAEMGCNAIRTSHNMPAPELLELCDEMGIMVIDEAFDCWHRGKCKKDYHLFFDEWHEKDLVNFVRRDRNHPCVILWSSGNEILEQGHTEDQWLSKELTGIFHREDPSRLVTAGCNYPSAASNGFANTIDVFGFNYKPHMYERFHRENPTIPYYSSESASCVSSRGEYFFPVSDVKSEGFFNYQISSYDLYAPGWAMKPELEWLGLDENYPAAMGEFVWTGFDYIGEPTPYQEDETILLNYHSEEERQKIQKQMAQYAGKSPSRSSYFGIIDLCGFKKDRFYIYQARWRPEHAMAHILPHWNWPERIGQVTPVHVYTSGDQAELFLNGKSLGKKTKPDFKPQSEDTEVDSLTTGRKAEASSQENDKGNTPNKGCDGDLKTRWCASEGSTGQWWQVDLEKVVPVKSCVIFWERDSGQYHYQVKTSVDGNDWQTVADMRYQNNEQRSTLAVDTEARYVRVEFPDLRDGAWASFYECLVYTDEDTMKKETVPQEHYRIRWDDVVYEPGELRVVAYKDGRPWATDVMKTTGPAAEVKLECDRDVIDADGSDLSFVTVKIVDEEGLTVPRSKNLVRFHIEGPGEIVAVGNGDATSHESFQAMQRKAYNGMCLAVVRSQKGKTGTVKLTAASEGLKSDTVKIKCTKN